MERAEGNIVTRATKNISTVINKTQFPSMLVWGCTVQKLKGLRSKSVVVSFDLVKEQRFNNGQMYAASCHIHRWSLADWYT